MEHFFLHAHARGIQNYWRYGFVTSETRLKIQETDPKKRMPIDGYTQEQYAHTAQETRTVPQHIVRDKRRHYESSSEVPLICSMDRGHAAIDF